MPDTPTPKPTNPVPRLYVTLDTGRRQVRVYRVGGAMVRAVKVDMISIAPHVGCGAEVAINEAQAVDLVDAVATAAGYFPENPNLDAQRDRIRERAEQLRQLRGDVRQDPGTAALAELALSRHVGHHLADAAAMIYACRDHMADYTVAHMAAEVVGMLDAMAYTTDITNPQDRIQAHMHAIDQLRDQLPKPGETDMPETTSGK